MNTSQSATNAAHKKSNFFGALASGLCLIHCVAMPLFFVAQATATHHHEDEHGHDHHDHPDMGWWGSLDFIFLALSIVAVFYSAKNTSLKWMPLALYASWAVLAFIVLNEKLHLMHLPHEAIYLPTLALIGLHIYNIRYCDCEKEESLVPE
ncbi:MAG: MerC domain-containing protein [Bacteroidota bacterium]